MKHRIVRFLLALLIILALCMSSAGCSLSDLEDWLPELGEQPEGNGGGGDDEGGSSTPSYDLGQLPAFDGVTAYVVINDDLPFFGEEDLARTEPFEEFSSLDSLGRCGVTFACVAIELMPTEDRESIGMVKPSGWQTVKYDHISGKYLYNRCHLIGFQLTGENANERNLITGTRFLNIDGMLPFENMVADHVSELEHRVLYRVTPIFEGQELVARGVLMEGLCITEGCEDDLHFCVYAYNNQPGVVINYATGESALSGEPLPEGPSEELGEITFVLNTSSKRFHLLTCSGADSMKPQNRAETDKSRDELIAEGYVPCGTCNP